MKVKSIFFTFIDDYSRKTWVYILQEKSEAFNVFKIFKARVENETGRTVKNLRTDCGGKYYSKVFADFCETSGIWKELTTAYTLQQNGVAERKNRTILNMVCSLLARGRVPKEFCPEAVNWSIHISNKCPTFALRDVTPEEAWSGSNPAIDHFKIFGSIAYAHVPEVKRKKLDDRGETCVFLGVSDISKAYKLFNPLTKKVMTSRDVVFYEEDTWEWSIEKSSPIVFYTGAEEVVVMPESAENSAFTTAGILPDVAEISPTTETVPATLEETDAAEQPLRRAHRRPVWMTDYKVAGIDVNEDVSHFALFADCDPTTFENAVKEEKWRKAMDDEIDAIERNGTWELSDLPKGQKTIGVKWVYKTKLKEDGEIDKYKARLVAKGYKQEHGVDYTEVFAPVARHDTIRMVIALAAQNSWPIFQLDVKSAFLHGYLEEEVFIEYPSGYIRIEDEQKVYKLKKALYGLKPAPRAWYSRIEAYFRKVGFLKCPYEHSLFVKIGESGKMLIVCLYVDDLIFTGNDSGTFSDF